MVEMTQTVAQETEQYRLTNNIKELELVADKFDTFSQKITQLKLQDPQLIPHQKKLANLYQTYGKYTHQLLQAIPNKEAKTARAAQKTIKQTAIDEQELIRNLNLYCQQEN